MKKWETARRLRASAIAAALLAFASPATAVDFDDVVSLGDASLDVAGELGRAPVASEHVAQRLGAAHTLLAVEGTSTATLLSTGQHTTAAASFGAGDLAVVWVGAEDFLANQDQLNFGNYFFLNAMDANLDTAVSTLRTAGLEVVLLTLPDLSLTPAVQLEAPGFALLNYRVGSEFWRNRVNGVAATHGAIVIDIYALSQLLDTSPQSFALYGVLPVLAPSFGDIGTCPSCVWFNEALPSAMTQGFIANEIIAALNATFDPGGSMPIDPLSNLELFNLTQLVPVPVGPLVALALAGGLVASGVSRLRRRA